MRKVPKFPRRNFFSPVKLRYLKRERKRKYSSVPRRIDTVGRRSRTSGHRTLAARIEGPSRPLPTGNRYLTARYLLFGSGTAAPSHPIAPSVRQRTQTTGCGGPQAGPLLPATATRVLVPGGGLGGGPTSLGGLRHAETVCVGAAENSPRCTADHMELGPECRLLRVSDRTGSGSALQVS